MSKIYLPNSTQLDTLNEKLGDIGETLAGQQLVTKANVVSALGYEPAEKEGTYELIETITLEEDTASIERTAEPDGTAYNFSNVAIFLCSSSAVTSSWVDNYLYTDDNQSIYYGTTIPSTDNWFYQVMAHISNGFLAAQARAYTFVALGNGQFTFTKEPTSSYIAKLKFLSLKAGTTIKIYGIRA